LQVAAAAAGKDPKASYEVCCADLRSLHFLVLNAVAGANAAAAAAARLENTLNYGMERIWAIGVMKGSNSVAFGFDEGVAVVKIGERSSSSSSSKCVGLPGVTWFACRAAVDAVEPVTCCCHGL
jgi:hypothetical protein